MKRHRGLALWMGAVMAVAAVCPAEGTIYTKKVQAEEQTISMTELAASGEDQGKAVTIGSPEELRSFAAYVNEGNSTEGKVFRLQKDITLSTLSFEYKESKGKTIVYDGNGQSVAAIGQGGLCYQDNGSTVAMTPEALLGESVWKAAGTKEHPFEGQFDGDGHTIKGMAAVQTGGEIQGLFGVVGSKGTVGNVILEDSLAAGSGCVGGIAGINQGRIDQAQSQNVMIIGTESTIQQERDDMDRDKGAGGITGVNHGGDLTNCALRGEKSRIVYGGGGIAGLITGGNIIGCENHSDMESLGGNMGGISGFIFKGTIRECSNYGKLTLTFASQPHINLAGIVGGTYTSQRRNVVINTCFNYGDVIQNEREASDTYQCLDSIGGITGRYGGGVIGNCGNYGKVGMITEKQDADRGSIGGALGVMQIGGIAGGCDSDCQIINCYNVGEILGDISYTGGITGRKNGIDIQGCYTIGKISQKLGTGQLCGFIEGGSIRDCYYLNGGDRTAYSEKTANPDCSITNCRGINGSDVRNDLTDLLNDFAESNNSIGCTLRIWQKGRGGYPIFGTTSELEQTVVSPGSWDDGDLSTETPQTGSPKPSETASAGNDTKNPEQTTPSPTALPAGSSEQPFRTGSPAGESAQPSRTEPSAGESEQPSRTGPPAGEGEQPSQTGSPAGESAQPFPSASPQGSNAAGQTVSESSITLKLKLSDDLKMPTGVQVSLYNLRGVEITWHQVAGAQGYAIYRKEGKNGSWKKLELVRGRTRYMDYSIRKGKNYRYKIFAYAANGENVRRSLAVTGKQISIPYHKGPKVSYRTETEGEKHYLRIQLRKYYGEYVEIYVKRNGIIQKTTLHPISKYKGVFRLSYTKKKAQIYCKIRTWKERNGKKKYSAYSEMKKLKL